ncbi:hypothetical protein DFH29DRAFT_1009329 [Suillus ampliporus]|nr:hypothetical protein DFH29DRAFT_1009329 [Suillus ampliporus]
MPPKGQRKGGKGGGKKSGTPVEGGASHLHLDERPIKALPVKNDIGKETQKLDTQLAKNRMGVAWIDLLKTPNKLKFGTYNDRPENDAETNKLIGSFKDSGIVSMKETSAIPIIIDPKRIKAGLELCANFNEPEDVPMLELIDRADIVVASGQHRLSAVRRYTQGLEDEYRGLEKKRAKIAGLKNITEEHVETYNDIREEMGRIMGVLEGIGKWGVVVYNSVTLLAKGDQLASHLSRNSTLHEYKETEEEVLITILRRIYVVYKAAPVEVKFTAAMQELHEIRKGKDKNARLQKVLHNDALCLILATCLLQLGPHFRRRPELLVTWLAKSIDVCMGLFVMWIKKRCQTLRQLGSPTTFPDHKTVEALLQKAEKGDEAAKSEVHELRQSILAYGRDEEGDISMWAEVMDELDAHAITAFDEVQDSMEDMTSTYISRLSSYRQNVIEALKKKWSLNDVVKGGDNKIVQHLDRVVARVLLHLTPDAEEPRAPEPLIGGFMLDMCGPT